MLKPITNIALFCLLKETANFLCLCYCPLSRRTHCPETLWEIVILLFTRWKIVTYSQDMIIENRGWSKKAAISPAIQFPLFAALYVDLLSLNSLGPGYIVSSIGKPLPSQRTSIAVNDQDQSWQVSHFYWNQTMPNKQARKPRSYASLKLRPTDLLTYSQG